MLNSHRNIDRILVSSSANSQQNHNHDMLLYKEHGLLLCEVHVLRQLAKQVMPKAVNREFVEDVKDLVELRTGVKRQMKVVERIRWAYGRFFV
jgi:nuclear control of ATPase protein 2